MTITFTPFEITISLIVLVLGLAVIGLVRVTWRLDQFKKGLIAHAKAAQQPPTPQLIAQWRYLYETLPKGSPKHMAYKNRLIEIGVLNEQGEYVQAEEKGSQITNCTVDGADAVEGGIKTHGD